jgi:hypothetical protein
VILKTNESERTHYVTVYCVWNLCNFYQNLEGLKILFLFPWVSGLGSQDSSVSIATCYGLVGPGLESWWGARFFTQVQTGSEAHPASYTLGTGSFPGVKRLGHGTDHPSPYSTEVNERVKLYLHSPSGPSWPIVG